MTDHSGKKKPYPLVCRAAKLGIEKIMKNQPSVSTYIFTSENKIEEITDNSLNFREAFEQWKQENEIAKRYDWSDPTIIEWLESNVNKKDEYCVTFKNFGGNKMERIDRKMKEPSIKQKKGAIAQYRPLKM